MDVELQERIEAVIYVHEKQMSCFNNRRGKKLRNAIRNCLGVQVVGQK